jgi:putative transposase
MSNYRRARATGGTYFFTVVAGEQRKILTALESREALRNAINVVKRQYPFTVEAWVLLPEHLHCIWTLPEGDRDYSKRWGLIKAGFSKQTRNALHHNARLTASKQKHRETSVWQRRFLEHSISDEEDFRRHMDYVHYNPVKHGLVNHVKDWPYSTFHRYAAKGVYPEDWGNDVTLNLDGEFGE